jgi:hypothetical protein
MAAWQGTPQRHAGTRVSAPAFVAGLPVSAALMLTRAEQHRSLLLQGLSWGRCAVTL